MLARSRGIETLIGQSFCFLVVLFMLEKLQQTDFCCFCNVSIVGVHGGPFRGMLPRAAIIRQDLYGFLETKA